MEVYGKFLFIFFLILSAYLLRRTGIFKEEDSESFVKYVIYFALPATILSSLTDIKVSGESLLIPLTAWSVILLSLGTGLLVGKFLSLKGSSLRTFLIVSSFGNTAFLGYPLAYAVGGEEALTYAILYDQLGSLPLVLTLGFFLASGKTKAGEILKFPPFLALLLALFFPFSLPPLLKDILGIVKDSLIPVILFSIGLKFHPARIELSERLFAAILIKQVISPLFALLFVHLFSLKGIVAKIVVLESGMPTMIFAGVLAMKYRLDLNFTLSSISLGMGVSFLIVPLFLKILP